MKGSLTNYVKLLIEELFNLRVRVGRFKPKNIGGFNLKNGMFIRADGVKLITF